MASTSQKSRPLVSVRRRFEGELQTAEQIVALGDTRPMVSALHEAAFLRAFVAWERFLEASFFQFLLGRIAPKGRPPRRYYQPPSLSAAVELLDPHSRGFVDWTNPQLVAGRARSVFRSGRPFAPALGTHTTSLREMRGIRHAIAHNSKAARGKFEVIVRSRLGTCPPQCTPGQFLSTIVPHSAPPTPFLDDYLDTLLELAEQIVPS